MNINLNDTTIQHEWPDVTDYEACRIENDIRDICLQRIWVHVL